MVQEKIPVSRDVSPNNSKIEKEPSESNIDKNKVNNTEEKAIFDLANNYIQG